VFSTFARRALGASALSMFETIGALGRLDFAAMLIDDEAGTVERVSRVIASVARESGRKRQPQVVEAEEGNLLGMVVSGSLWAAASDAVLDTIGGIGPNATFDLVVGCAIANAENSAHEEGCRWRLSTLVPTRSATF
jgi:hypothetical protein